MKMNLPYLACLSLLLVACGGGGSTTVVPSITSVTPNQLKYSQQSKFTVVGANLNKGVTLTSTACDNIQKESGATDKQLVFSCTVAATGKIKLSFALAGSSTAHSSEHTVAEPRVLIKTSMGNMEVELNYGKAPKTVKNFMTYVNSGFFSNTVFHRVMKGFMIQGGGFDTSLQQKTTNAPIDAEVGNGLKNERGTIAMARGSALNSATSQFFINAVDNSTLRPYMDNSNTGYTVFGKTVDNASLTVVDSIEKVTTTTVNGMADVPVTPVIITEVTQTQ